MCLWPHPQTAQKGIILMQEKLKKIGKAISSVYCSVAIAAVVGIFVIMTVQCFFRYILNNSITWSEELARFLFVWASMLGAVVVTGNRGHAAIKMLDSLFPAKVNQAKELIFDIVIIALGIMIFVCGLRLVGSTWNQKSAALQLSYAYVYMAIPAGGIGIAIESAINAIELALGFKAPNDANKKDLKEEEN